MTFLKYIRLALLFTMLLFAFVIAKEARWQMSTEMPIPVAGGKAIVHDSLIYIFGGYLNPSDITNSVNPIIQAYSPTTEKWYVSGLMSASRAGFVAGEFEDVAYMAGGVWDFAGNPFVFSIESFNFGDFAAIPYNFHPEFNRINANGLIHNGIMYMIGGQPVVTTPTPNLSFIAAFDIPSSSMIFQEDSLYSSQDMPSQQMITRINDDLYIFGGVRFGISRRVYKFNMLTNELVEVESLSSERAGGAAIAVSDTEVFLIGGYNEQPSPAALDSVTIYRTDAPGGITNFGGPFMNHRRKDLMAARIDDTVYVFGGVNEHSLQVPAVEKIFIPPVGIEDRDVVLPEDFSLEQNYPNPFNPNTTIAFSLKNSGFVNLTIYNLNGQRITTLVNQQHSAGRFAVEWQGINEGGTVVSSGVYIAQLTVGNITKSRKMVLIK